MPFQFGLTLFVGPGVYPIVDHLKAASLGYATALLTNITRRLERLDRDDSLSWEFAKYVRKKFYNIGPTLTLFFYPIPDARSYKKWESTTSKSSETKTEREVESSAWRNDEEAKLVTYYGSLIKLKQSRYYKGQLSHKLDKNLCFPLD